jgi:hypothetical protein
MKKIFISMTAAVMMLCGCGTNGNMNNLGNAVLTDVLTGGQAANGTTTTNTGAAVGNILQSVLGGTSKMTQSGLIGTWTYSKPGCAFTSEQLLAQAGGEIVASEIKTKLQPSFQKVGITSSNTQVTFNQDGTFSAKVAGKNWSGRYTFDEAQSKITMSGILINVNCYAKRNVDGIGLLFESSKLLSLLQTMSALSGNQTLQTIGELSKSYDGLRMGFDMKK